MLAGCGDERFSPSAADLAVADLAILDDARVALDFHAPPDLAASGPIYYIATNGSDGNDGLSPATALRTFDLALGKLVPGATLILLDGNYGAVLVDCAGHAMSGTAAQP